ncbi:DNA-processing protein DprA [Leptospira sp. 2 VSF19]|uniref:DNA-processing protein DprA n=1 Tax=Leptospira soteropolitanensis TaxID=2950025 RepID=A0AAW5VJ68_9LEPT|nr:DNA-processing protein DprA [Leptospira soteropolitanensis]MCW7494363.1 DNA-processing protein DprA [Leptospira soteropolitanensis]MCW7501928.1 DNA-processing protein DprA [Leptospira soteropolitanensis]MCW7524209.1 DNA-processing protein DprA [Leptospira soteropolitanensis]MCW7528074.1 DNA-processing protein DprA [Leptospira soteropolitanensis]MCW7531928.1 DNA-processing protein DprA [Leptospira soteropolitanensis]
MVVSILGHPKISAFLRKTRVWCKYKHFSELYQVLSIHLDEEIWKQYLAECTQWEKSKDPNWKLVSIFDPEYPKTLKEIYDPPLVLACLGNLSLLKSSIVAIVGTRKSSPVSLSATRKLVEVLSANKSLSIVSGMALGIDREAFLSAWEFGLPVIGVLGTTLGMEYPPGNRDLYKRIKEDPNQLLITEFLLKTEPAKWTFPKRNRVISGLSDKVYIMESGRKSGTISTAYSAMEQNREIYVFDHPKQFDNEGGRLLIRQGAHKLISEIKFSIEEVKVKNASMSYEDWCKKRTIPSEIRRDGRWDFDFNL